MGRLTGLPGRLTPLAPRVRAMPKRAEGFYTSEAWRRYRSAHRAWTVKRHGGCWCARCGSTRRLILDHKHERRDGGADLPPFEDCEWLCGSCHNRKTAAARKARAEGRAVAERGGGRKSTG